MNYTHTAVINHLIHKLKRLQSKIQSLQLLSQRFSVFRMLAFAAGALLTWLAAMAAGNTAGWLVFAASLLVFVVIIINLANQGDIQVFMQYIIPKSLFYTANLQHNASPYN